MDRAKDVLRSCGFLIAVALIFAVSGASADTIGGRDQDREVGASFIKSQTVGTSWHYADLHIGSGALDSPWSWSSTRFADTHSNTGFELGGTFGRSYGLRDGEWFWSDLKDFTSNDNSGWGSGAVGTPEPGTFLLLANGVGVLFFSRRRWLKA